MRDTYVKNPRKNKLIMSLAEIASYVFTLKYRIFYRDRVKFGKNFITNWAFKISGPGKVTFGDDILAWAYNEPNIFRTLDKDAEIIIGNNTRLNGLCCQAKKSIKTGNNCIFGSVLLNDTDFHSTAPDRMTNPNAPIKTSPIEIADNVWVCGKSYVLKGVHIGEGSIVGFGSVVTKDVPANTIVAGNPAQIVGKPE